MPNTTVRETCNLRFSTSLDSTRTIRVPDPGAGLTPANVTQAASRFIAGNPFDESVGSLVQLENAYVIQQTRIQLLPTA